MGLQTALLLAPTAARIGANLLDKGGSKSQFEEQAFRMADLFGSEASVPLTESRAFKSGMSVIREQDQENRRAINNQSAVTGATDEAKLANIQDSNENLNQGIQRLLEFASRNRDKFRNMQLRYLGAGENARQGRLNQRNQNWKNILDPASQAASAFAMSDLFGPGSGKNKDTLNQLGEIMKVPGWSGL